jgi:hypothetical protein
MFPMILAEAGFSPIFGGITVLFLLIGIAAAFFWVWMLMDVLKNEPPGTERLAWGLAGFFTGFIGAVIYYFIKHRPRVAGTAALHPTR